MTVTVTSIDAVEVDHYLGEDRREVSSTICQRCDHCITRLPDTGTGQVTQLKYPRQWLCAAAPRQEVQAVCEPPLRLHDPYHRCEVINPHVSPCPMYEPRRADNAAA